MRALRLFRFGLSATMSHFGLAVVACALFGGVSGAASGLLYSQEHALQSWAGHDQMKGMLLLFGLDILLQVGVTVLLGPIFQAAASFSAFRHSRGKPGSVSLGLNFALTRYKRMFAPHAKAWLTILLGIQLFLIPGIIYWNQFALVDSVAVFEKSKRPLRRSRQLTQGYRRTIFVMAFPWLIYGVPALVIVPELVGISPALMVPHQMLVALYLFVVFAGYGRLYLERTGQHEAGGEAETASSPAEPASDA